MDDPVGERRAEPRLAATALEIERATLRPGCLVAVLDLSANGAQVQSERPLRPGSRIHVRIAARHWTVAVAADVVRCSVWIVQADAVISSRGAQIRGGVQLVLGRAGRRGRVVVMAPP